MTEYEKMISGELYFAGDPELTEMRKSARSLLDQINESVSDIREGERLTLCKKLFGALGAHLWLQPPFYCDYGKNICLGDSVYFNFNCILLDVAPVSIGSFTLLGPNVQIYTAGHPLEWQPRKDGLEFGKAVTIGEHVWIGGSAVICPGVTIGDRSVIAAGAVVTTDVPSDVLVGGVPAKILKKLGSLDRHL